MHLQLASDSILQPSLRAEITAKPRNVIAEPDTCPLTWKVPFIKKNVLLQLFHIVVCHSSPIECVWAMQHKKLEGTRSGCVFNAILRKSV